MSTTLFHKINKPTVNNNFFFFQPRDKFVSKFFSIVKQFFAFALLSILFSYQDIQPGPRQAACFIYSPVTKSLLLIDGFTIHPPDGKSIVFGWNNEHWDKISVEGPDTKTLSSGALSSDNNKIVVFGGIGKNGYTDLHGDTWEFDGTSWQKLETNDIGTRDHHKMVYAQNIHAFVMYGGQNSQRKGDSSTWLLQANKWSELKITGPGIRYHFGMAYDPFRKKVLLYGGLNESGLQKDTWEFDGKNWSMITKEGPGSRSRFAMVYDPERKMVLLYGGDAGKKKVDSTISPDGELWDLYGDIWGWNGKKWILINDDGPKRMLPALGYDESKRMLVLYGGGDEFQHTHSDTWQLQNSKWVKLMDNGTWQWNGREYEKIAE